MEYRNKNVLLTGAAHGIGKAFANYFSSKGANLILIDIDGDNLKTVADSLVVNKHKPITLVKDLSENDERGAIFHYLDRNKIEIDILVNNVGIGYCSLFHETSWEQLEKIIDVNVKGSTHLVWKLLPKMIKKDEGIIINVSSTGAFCGANRSAVYTGSKAYVTNFTEALDMELMGTNVQTLSAHPGATDTNFWESAGTTKMAFYKTVKMMSPEKTVAEFMTALENGKSFAIAGWKNRLMVFLSKYVPREILKKMAIEKYK